MVTISAQGRGYSVYGRGGAVAADGSGDVAKSFGCRSLRKVGRRIRAGLIAGNAVRDTEGQPIVQGVGQIPGLHAGIEYPFLQSCRGLAAATVYCCVVLEKVLSPLHSSAT